MLVKYGGRSKYIFEVTEKITEIKKVTLYHLCVFFDNDAKK